MWKKVSLVCYVLVLLVLAAATVMEKNRGTSFVQDAVYGAWWFVVLWGVLAAAGVAYIVRRRVRHVPTLLLHASFLVILLGALLTHVTSRRGMMELRPGSATDSYYVDRGAEGVAVHHLPFRLRLERFETRYHAGTDAASDYVSRFIVIDGAQRLPARVSMNHIFSYRGYRFYQASFSADGRGTVLSINSDPWGIPVTYTGYALLFLSLLWLLFDPRGQYRRVLRSPLLRRGALGFLLLCAVPRAEAQQVAPRPEAAELGKLCMLYNGRICPVQTYALDFCQKIYGARTYKGFTAEQVLTGWLFFGRDWANEPFIHVKGRELRETLQLDAYCSLRSLFNPLAPGGYVLGTLVEEYYGGERDKLHAQAADVDAKLMLIMQLQTGQALKVLPYTAAGRTTWYAPADTLPPSLGAERAKYFGEVFPQMTSVLRHGDTARMDSILTELQQYQRRNAGASLPSSARYRAERAGNAVPFATILFMVNLACGLVALGYLVFRLTRRRRLRLFDVGLPLVLLLSFLALTAALALRWTASGNVPMSNGYETMLTAAWFVELIALLLWRRFPVVPAFGLLLSGFFLLVSHINQMDPAIGQLMPVLNSPLLSVHVSIIMMAYALLSFTFLCGVLGLCLRRHAATLQALSGVFLYPAVVMLALGIFIGAVWANISWGQYWSWDPKETWALITLLTYALPLHGASLPFFRKPVAYHAYLTLAFLTILMTYFGVNYVLGGMHSYA